MKKRWTIVAFFAVLFAVALLYGMYKGDADYVLKNANNFCFS